MVKKVEEVSRAASENKQKINTMMLQGSNQGEIEALSQKQDELTKVFESMKESSDKHDLKLSSQIRMKMDAKNAEKMLHEFENKFNSEIQEKVESKISAQDHRSLKRNMKENLEYLTKSLVQIGHMLENI